MIQQIIANSIISAATYGIVGIGFSLIFSTVRFFHFAYGAVIAIGAYLVFAMSAPGGIPLWAASILAVLCCAAVGGAMDLALYRPLRAKRTSSLGLLLASLGLYVVLQNTISLAFGDDAKALRPGTVREGLTLLGARVTIVQLAIVGISVLLAVSLYALQKATRVGKALRAVADDPELAEISGIRSRRLVLLAFSVGSAIAGLAGVLVALDIDMMPTMGLRLLMMGIVAVVVGGAYNIGGVLLGALALGTGQHIAAWTIGARWQDAVAFILLLAVLLLRPQGLLGQGISPSLRRSTEVK